jgi:hypothetical protein
MKKFIAYLHHPITFEHSQTYSFQADGLMSALVLAYQKAYNSDLYVAAVEEQKNA